MHAIALQWSIRRMDPEANMGMAADLLRASSPQPGDLIVLPELWPTGYSSGDRLAGAATEHGGRWSSFCADLASSHGVIIAGTVPARTDNALTNRLLVSGPEGTLGYYDKIHLFPPMREQQLFVPGTRADPIPLPGGPVMGPVICYDVRFPELFRLLALRGATVFVMPSQFPDPKEDLWHIFLASRAAENQAYLVACNRTGESGSFTFFGSSAVYDPLGRCLGRLGREEGYLKVTIDPAVVVETRDALPVLPHARLSLEVKTP
ncbi:carbon-nitrogen family hydrolase [Candidatus Fermentibacteria bacterium]|nr:carbon-nitrogen family hydrolase [Candidatus Fermentibacteria bacterium]